MLQNSMDIDSRKTNEGQKTMPQEHKYLAVAAYITPAGWIVAYIMKLLSGADTKYCIFHLRQGLGLLITFGILWLALHYTEWYIVSQLVQILYFICIVIGVLGALDGKCRYQPLFGKLYYRLITFIK